MKRVTVDKARLVIIPGSAEDTLNFAVNDWLKTAQEAIAVQGYFACALSGGSTPKAIYQALAQKKEVLDWSKVKLFWSDERACGKDDPESNYKMAMEALSPLPIDPKNIFPMEGLGCLKANAESYAKLIETHIPSKRFDLMMLGMGEDGHTASLFPESDGLHATERDVIANFIPSKGVWRLSVTFRCINNSDKIVVYIVGQSKAKMVQEIFRDKDHFPIQRVGTEKNPAIFILDDAASSLAFNGIQ